MSYSAENYFGYRMDCTKDSYILGTKDIDFERLDKFEFTYEKHQCFRNCSEYTFLFKELESLGFVLEKDISEDMRDFITLITDGLNANYVWLVYVKTVNYESNYFDENIKNELLKQYPIPEDIQKKLRRCYEIIFNKRSEESNKKNIYLQDIVHVV